MTEIGQVYVVVPGPGQCAEGCGKVRIAMKATMSAIVLGLGLLATPVAAQFGAPPPPADPNAADAEVADGKPDLSGFLAGRRQNNWLWHQGSTVGDMFRRCTPFQNKNCMEWTNQSEDWPFMSTSRLGMSQPVVQA